MSFFGQLLFQLLQRQRVHHILLGEPAFAGDGSADSEKAGMFDAMGVAVYYAFHTAAFGVLPITPVEVEAIGIGIKLNPRAGLGAGVDDGLLVKLLRCAFQQQSSAEVAEHVDIRVFGGGNEALGVVLLITAGHGVGGDDHFQVRPEGGLEIESFFEYVHLDAAEEAKGVAVVLKLLVNRGNFLELFFNTRFVEAVGLKGCLGMVGDCPLGEAEAAHLFGDFLDAFMAVAPIAVIVQRAFEVGPFNEAREVSVLRGVEFTAILA